MKPQPHHTREVAAAPMPSGPGTFTLDYKHQALHILFI